VTKLDLSIERTVPQAASAHPKSVDLAGADIRRSDESAAIWLALGQSLVGRGLLEQALLCFKAAIACDAGHAAAFAARAVALFQLGRHDEAMADYMAALALEPANADVWINLGVLYQKADCADEAMSCFETALLHRPSSADAWANRGRTQFASGDLDGALQSFSAALVYRPGDGRLHFDRAVVLLAKGEWAAGWQAYDARLKLNIEPRILTRCFPLWQGEPLEGKRVLALSEQGIGDVFQFVRFVRQLSELGAVVTLHVQSHLLAVLQGLCADCTVIDHFEADARFDFEIPLMSLPGRLARDASVLAPFEAYLSADNGRCAYWDRISRDLAPNARRIGICWQGNPGYSGDRRRSVPLAAFRPISALDGVRLISLQKHIGIDQMAASDIGVIDLGPEVDGDGAFLDTAAIIAGLDLVITSDTAVAHLAGAMGRPVWLMLADVPDWRWGTTGKTTPWYPTIRLFRQTTPGDWDSVISAVVEALRADVSL
jgi:tetratricopeptide (TPR) repeat protein